MTLRITRNPFLLILSLIIPLPSLLHFEKRQTQKAWPILDTAILVQTFESPQYDPNAIYPRHASSVTQSYPEPSVSRWEGGGSNATLRRASQTRGSQGCLCSAWWERSAGQRHAPVTWQRNRPGTRSCDWDWSGRRTAAETDSTILWQWWPVTQWCVPVLRDHPSVNGFWGHVSKEGWSLLRGIFIYTILMYYNVRPGTTLGSLLTGRDCCLKQGSHYRGTSVWLFTYACQKEVRMSNWELINHCHWCEHNCVSSRQWDWWM